MCLLPFSNVKKISVTLLFIRNCSSKRFLNENFLNKRKLWVTVTLTLKQSWLPTFKLYIPKQSKVIPQSLKSLLMQTEGDMWHMTKARQWKEIYLENLKERDDLSILGVDERRYFKMTSYDECIWIQLIYKNQWGTHVNTISSKSKNIYSLFRDSVFTWLYDLWNVSEISFIVLVYLVK